MLMAPRLDYITRTQWGAGPVTVGHAVPHTQFRGLVVHHDVIAFNGWTANIIEEAKVHARTLKNARPDLGNDWPYSFGLAPNYQDRDHTIVVEGRGFGRTGAHTKGYNSTRYGVVLFGDYRDGEMQVTAGQVRGARWLGAWLHNRALAAPTLAHKQAARTQGYSTECPGGESAMGLVVMSQPPFTQADFDVFNPGVPHMPDTSHAYNPPIMLAPDVGIVDSLNDPVAGGAWVLLTDGGVITTGTARFFGTPYGKPYIVGNGTTSKPEHAPVKLVPYTHTDGVQKYIVRDVHGHDYGHGGF